MGAVRTHLGCLGWEESSNYIKHPQEERSKAVEKKPRVMSFLDLVPRWHPQPKWLIYLGLPLVFLYLQGTFTYIVSFELQNNSLKKIVVQSRSRVWLIVNSWTAAHQASLFFTISQSLLKLMSIESVMLSNHLILHSNLGENQGLCLKVLFKLQSGWSGEVIL